MVQQPRNAPARRTAQQELRLDAEERLSDLKEIIKHRAMMRDCGTDISRCEGDSTGKWKKDHSKYLLHVPVPLDYEGCVTALEYQNHP
jgi:hypothetical protein